MGYLQLPFQMEKLVDGSLVAIVNMKGSIDGSTVKKFELEMMGLSEKGVKYLILNFEEVGYMNSTGLGILVKVLDKFQEGDGDMKLVQVPRKVADLFDMLGISSILQIYKDVDEALASLPMGIASNQDTVIEAPTTGENDGTFDAAGIVISADFFEDTSAKEQQHAERPSRVASVEISTEPPEIEDAGIEISSETEDVPQATISETEDIPEATISETEDVPEATISETEDVPEATISETEDVPEDVPQATISEVEELPEVTISETEDVPQATISEVEDVPEVTISETEDVPQLEIPDSSLMQDREVDSLLEDKELVTETNAFEIPPVMEEKLAAASTEIEMTEVDERSEYGRGNELEVAGAMEDFKLDEISIDENVKKSGQAGGEKLAQGEEIDKITEETVHDSQELAEIEQLEAEVFASPSEIKPKDETMDIAQDQAVVGSEHDISSFKISGEEIPAISDISGAEEKDQADLSEISNGISNSLDTNGLPLESVLSSSDGGEIPGPDVALGLMGNISDASDMVLETPEVTETPSHGTSVPSFPSGTRGRTTSETEAGPLSRKTADDVSDAKDLDYPTFAKYEVTSGVGSIFDRDEVARGGAAVSKAKPSSTPPLPTRPVPARQPAPAPMPISSPGSVSPQTQPTVVPVSEPIHRKTTVRYYEQMNPSKPYPLVVGFAKEAMKRVKLDRVQQTTGQKTLQVQKDRPEVSVIPCLSGCLVSPPYATVDVTPETSSAEFWVTPVMEGNINGWIDINYQGKSVEKIPLRMKSVKQTIAKIGAIGAVLTPILSYILESFQFDVKKEALRGFPRLLALINTHIGLYSLGFLLMAVFIAVGVYFYMRNRPKEAEILEKFLTVESQQNQQ